MALLAVQSGVAVLGYVRVAIAGAYLHRSRRGEVLSRDVLVGGGRVHDVLASYHCALESEQVKRCAYCGRKRDRQSRVACYLHGYLVARDPHYSIPPAYVNPPHEAAMLPTLRAELQAAKGTAA